MSDSWNFYFCLVEDRKASVFVDLGIRHGRPVDVPARPVGRMQRLRLAG